MRVFETPLLAIMWMLLTYFNIYTVEKDDEEMKMEIGSPRDVQHVTHIGWDGTATANNPIMGWDNLIPQSDSHLNKLVSNLQHHYDLILSEPPQTTSPPPVLD